MKNNQDYDIGLDIGTNSVGYAVTDTNGNLLKFKGKNMWGVRLFSEGQSAKATRLFRCTRRRYERRKNRIALLQDIMGEDISQADKLFYMRLSQSAMWNEDRNIPDMYSLFNDKDFSDVAYFKNYPTVYHLRKHLMQSEAKEDIRLIYLSLHHILKYRGNFLYEGQTNVSAENAQVQATVEEFITSLSELYSIDAPEKVGRSIASTLKDVDKTKSTKQKEIIESFEDDPDLKAVYKNIASAMVGYKADFSIIFNLDSEENLKYALSAEDADIKLSDLLDDSQVRLYESLQKVYSAFILSEILKGENVVCLSDAMIEKYLKHQADLKLLKSVYKKFLHKDYSPMFRGEKDPKTMQYIKPKKLVTYTGYILGESCCTQEELYATIKDAIKKIAGNPDCSSQCDYINREIENSSFLPKINAKENGAIPYQLHLEELVKIVEKQGRYYPALAENIDKLTAILTFRIPYYVGPLNEKQNPEGSKQFSWMQRKVEGVKIYPWNFEDVVDINTTAEKFITRMTNQCTYLPNEEVIPKCSLLYSEYEVLNEIKQIKVNGKFLTFQVQMALYENVFKRYKTVSEDALQKWLIRERKYASIDQITGFQKEGRFATSLTAYIDFTSIFGEINSTNRKMIEKLILWITLFEDKKILKRKIENEMPDIPAARVAKICKLRYTGWSRLSEKLLNGISCKDSAGNERTIIETMRATKKNFMQIINDDDLGYKQAIEAEAKPEKLQKITADVIENLAGSKAIKRGIKQCAAVVEEIVSIQGKAPVHIHIEFAREEGAKKRTSTRYKKLKEKYDSITSNEDFRQIVKELREHEKRLDERMVYLYFIQNGKCLYSGEKLALNTLSQDCQIDHIIPQSYIKDDSFDNLALVLSGKNQEKGDNMLIKAEVRSSQREFWKSLYRNGLISEKKLKNLERDEFEEEQLKGFINRQLVETRQITKHVTNLFGAVYEDTKIIAIKAELISNLRSQYGFYKNREVNDYHHAHDAFLAAIVGRYVNLCHPYLSSDFDYFAISRFAANKENAVKVKFGYIIGSFANPYTDKTTGEVWDGQAELAKVRRCLGYMDCFISKKTEEQTGEFYKQTILPKTDDVNTKLIPIKANMPVSKYGGYIEPKQAYSAVVAYDAKKGREKKLVGIPLYVVKLQQTKPNAIISYLENLDYANPKILKDRIMQYQRITYDGNDYYLSSSMEVHNAKQLVLSPQSNRIVHCMNSKARKKTVTDADLIILYGELCDKMEKQYLCYQSIFIKLKAAKTDFESRPADEKIAIINQILVMLQANPSNGNFKNYNFAKLPDRVGRMKGKNLDVNKITFRNTSVTGLFEHVQYGKDM